MKNIRLYTLWPNAICTNSPISFPGRTYHRQESRLHTRPGTLHEGPRFKVVSVVLLSAAPSSYNPALTVAIRHSYLGACFHLLTHRFLQQPPLRDECISPWLSSVDPEISACLILKIRKYNPINRSQLQSGGISTGFQSRLASNSSWTSSQEIVLWVKLRYTWSSSAALSTRSRRDTTYVRQHKSSSWSLISVRSALVVVASPSHHRNCGTYFQLTFDSCTRSLNFSEKDSKLIVCSSPFFTTEDLCHQCDIYYYYYYFSLCYSPICLHLKKSLFTWSHVISWLGVTSSFLREWKNAHLHTNFQKTFCRWQRFLLFHTLFFLKCIKIISGPTYAHSRNLFRTWIPQILQSSQSSLLLSLE